MFGTTLLRLYSLWFRFLLFSTIILLLGFAEEKDFEEEEKAAAEFNPSSCDSINPLLLHSARTLSNPQLQYIHTYIHVHHHYQLIIYSKKRELYTHKALQPPETSWFPSRGCTHPCSHP